MKIYGKSDTGVRRFVNQDRFQIRQFGDDLALCAVFDGMGGANGGEQASSAAMHAFDNCITGELIEATQTGKVITASDAEKLLYKAAQTANAEIYKKGEDPSLEGMGTTVIAALILRDDIVALNIGDSRLYEVSRGTLRQVSKDNSYVQYLIDIGRITKEEAATHPKKNIITKCLGTEDEVEPDIYRIGEIPDKLLFCSDGLTNALSEGQIYDTLNDFDRTPYEKVSSLIDAANSAGGPDNITVILAEND